MHYDKIMCVFDDSFPAEDVPSFPSVMESMATHNVITDGTYIRLEHYVPH